MSSIVQRKELHMSVGGMPNKQLLLFGHRRFQTQSMHSVYWPKKTPHMVSQLQDHSKETQIGLYITSTLKDGSSAGHYWQELVWFPSGSISPVSISQYRLKVLTMKIIFVLRMLKLPQSGKDVSGPLLSRSMDNISQLSREKLSSTLITRMTASLMLKVLIILRTHMLQTDITMVGVK